MKFLLAGLAVIAAVAALFFRPPSWNSAAGAPPGVTAVAPQPSPLPFARGTAARWAPAGAPGIVVYVAGEVLRPGVYTLATGARAQAALVRAGGPKPDADLVAVNLAARLEDGTEVAVPKIGEAAPRGRRAGSARAHSASRTRGGHGRRRRTAPEGAAHGSVDLNSASADELATLPGLGPALAARIVAYREANGPFASVDELADVSGITPRMQEELADFIVVR